MNENLDPRIKLFVNQVKAGKMKLEDVNEKYRNQVEKALVRKED